MDAQAIPVLTGAAWRKSSYSGNSRYSRCVETAPLPHRVAVRDSKDPDGPVMVVASGQWEGLLSRAKGAKR